jgi:hypothetical protein
MLDYAEESLGGEYPHHSHPLEASSNEKARFRTLIQASGLPHLCDGSEPLW